MAAAEGSVRREGTRHIVERMNDTQIEVVAANWKQSASISHCSGTVIRVTGRCNGITISNCVKCGLIFDDCPLLEVNSGERLEVQAMQRLGRAEIDKSSDVTIHVPPSVTAKAGDFSMRSSRSSEVKLVVVGEAGQSAMTLVPCTIETTFNQEGEATHAAVQ